MTLLALFKTPGKHNRVAAVQECCKNRLVILFRRGYDPQKRHWQHFDRAISAVEYAQSHGLLNLLEDTLLLAGWPSLSIRNMLDENEYLGFVDLFDGRSYESQEESRAQFLWALCSGEYSTTDDDSLDEEAEKICLSLGIDWVDTFQMMRESKAAYQRLSTPGSWLEEESGILIPGIDFEFPKQYGKYSNGRRREQISEWPCVRKILEEVEARAYADSEPR
jgi:hypothetical protein